MLRITDLTIRRGGMLVLEEVSVTLGPGLWAVVGPNGAGKSTLLRAIAGVLSPARGRIEIDGHDLWEAPQAARRRLGYLPESPELFPYLTARELLRTVNAVRGLEPQAGEEQFGRWVRPAALDLRIGTLSAGQRRKLALVAATSHEPGLLLLDEPANTLDAAAVQDLRAILSDFREQQRTVLVATHRPEALDLRLDGLLGVRQRRVHHEPAVDVC